MVSAPRLIPVLHDMSPAIYVQFFISSSSIQHEGAFGLFFSTFLRFCTPSSIFLSYPVYSSPVTGVLGKYEAWFKTTSGGLPFIIKI